MDVLISTPPFPPEDIWPLDVNAISRWYVLGKSLLEWNTLAIPAHTKRLILHCNDNMWISPQDIAFLLKEEGILEANNRLVAWSARQPTPTSPAIDAIKKSAISSTTCILHYPWNLLTILDQLVTVISHVISQPEYSCLTQEQGTMWYGRNTKILPGVYIEESVIVGNGCTIGPNCYLRGPAIIGNGCRIGQAVEIKNTIVGQESNVAHLSYIGDSIIGERVNIGAGTITANLRHDHHTIQSQIHTNVSSRLISTHRTKFGTIIGNNAHLGIGTAILPGRKIGPNTSTYPRKIVSKDIL